MLVKISRLYDFGSWVSCFNFYFMCKSVCLHACLCIGCVFLIPEGPEEGVRSA